MKNLFKFGFLALAISLSVAACNTDQNAEGTDTTTVEADTTLSVDTTGAAADTTMAVDTTQTN